MKCIPCNKTPMLDEGAGSHRCPSCQAVVHLRDAGVGYSMTYKPTPPVEIPESMRVHMDGYVRMGIRPLVESTRGPAI